MNGYLVPRELGGTELGLSPQDFGAIDRDHNQMIFENEWLAFMELYDTLAEHRVTLTLTAAADDPVTPFDSNHDGRLSRGELARALATIRSWDVNGDGQISPEEVPQRFEGLFHLGALGSPAKAEMMPGMRRSEPPPASDAPAWFQRMDRNRDGEVSFREFLGPISVFRRLDTNHDGALDAEEARRAK
jgi:Ca2+-binding EF-hand superfamily protein